MYLLRNNKNMLGFNITNCYIIRNCFNYIVRFCDRSLSGSLVFLQSPYYRNCCNGIRFIAFINNDVNV